MQHVRADGGRLERPPRSCMPAWPASILRRIAQPVPPAAAVQYTPCPAALHSPVTPLLSATSNVAQDSTESQLTEDACIILRSSAPAQLAVCRSCLERRTQEGSHSGTGCCEVELPQCASCQPPQLTGDRAWLPDQPGQWYGGWSAAWPRLVSTALDGLPGPARCSARSCESNRALVGCKPIAYPPRVWWT